MAVYKNSAPFGSIVYSNLAMNLDATNVSSYIGYGTTWNSVNTPIYNFSGSLTSDITLNQERGRGSFYFQTSGYSSSFTNTGTDNTTMEVWFKYQTTSQIGLISYFGNSGTSGMGMYINNGSNGGIPGDKVSVLYGGTYYNALNTGIGYASLTQNVWTCLSLTRDTTTTTLYQNGVSVGSTTRTPNLNNTLLSQESVSKVSGSISIIRMYTKCLASNEVLQNYNALKSRFGL